ncbi:hypothetical protein DMN91_005344 [Ooceraea biroi]|uniref:Kinetochore protein NDC80 n=1 Tax=Ooceraea biroi TaxID=2015173 RepID=A0A026WYR0_OOCBI|nr:kinetochore protein NDC80 homolog [Ooceraea biroi]EZA61180.1 Kinetochore protein NDC80-like protein [Ooceraea biroi]RLU23066.1 hypothetical protein DMN91_005344 [Ooceraea biroi]
MHPNLAGRRSSTNPVRISMFEREDRNLIRTDRRATATLKGAASIETSHIPRPRFRSSSSDRAGSLGRKSSFIKTAGKSLLRQQTMTPVMPERSLIKHNAALTASSSRLHVPLQMNRSSSADRASSSSAKGPRKDTRPLMDKTYQMMLVNKIDDFFRVNQRSAILNSNGSLKPITLKMFVEVSDYLLKFFDAKHELTIANYVEEIPKCAKKLHYPGTITKSCLKTANTMHSWPHVLGWIGWLVEACQMREIAFDTYTLKTLPFMGTDQEGQSSRAEFLALLECYKLWNDEKHEEEADLLERYLQDVLIQQGITEEDIIQARKELEEDTLKLHMMEEENKEVDEKVEQLKRKLVSLQAKEATQLSNIKAKEEYIKEISAEKKQLNADCKTSNDQLQKGNVEYEKLVSTVKNQPMSKAEKENILKKCSEIQNYMHEFDKHLEEYEKELYTLDIKFASFNNNLNKAILAYNKEVFMHIDNAFDINFDELKLPEKGLLNPKIMDTLEEKAALTKTFTNLLAKQCIETQSLIHSDTLELKKLQEKIKSLPDEDHMKQEKSAISKLKADKKKKKADQIKKIDVLKKEIKDIQDAMPDINKIDLEIEEATEKLEAVNRRKVFLEASAKRFFDELYQILNEHRGEVYDLLAKYKDHT